MTYDSATKLAGLVESLDVSFPPLSTLKVSSIVLTNVSLGDGGQKRARSSCGMLHARKQRKENVARTTIKIDE
jgi:hypothetical protein